jgi:hypothetical protein
MSVKAIGENTASEFFETIIYMTAYNEARTYINDFTKDIDNNVLKEAIEGAANVLVFSLVFKLIQAQEDFIEKVFVSASALATLLLSGVGSKITNKLRKLKGVKLFRRFNLFSDTMNQRVALTNTVATATNAVMVSQSAVNSRPNQVSAYDTINSLKNTMYNRENLHMQFGNNMASRYNETLLFKLLTKSFTANDELLVKKILGRDTASVLNMEDLNKVADFMYTTDTNGNPIGLSEAFIDLINGLGFLHNK